MSQTQGKTKRKRIIRKSDVNHRIWNTLRALYPDDYKMINYRYNCIMVPATLN